MAMTPTEFGGAVSVDGYGPGFFRVAGQVWRGPVIATAAGARAWGGLDDMAALSMLAGQVDVLFLGLGAEMGRPPAALMRTLEDAGVPVEAMASRMPVPIAGTPRSKRVGRWRRTSMNTTIDSVSTANWVSARSGAPCTTKTRPMA